MGLVAAQIQKNYLLAYRHDLEYKIQLISKARMELSGSVNDLLHTGTDLSPKNPIIKQLEQRKARLNLLEKKLELQMNDYKARLKAVEIELKSVDGMINKNLSRAFKY